MDFKTYFSSLSKEEREAFARRAGTSVAYIQIHLMPRNRIPRPELMQKLCKASRGKISRQALLDFFYPEANAA